MEEKKTVELPKAETVLGSKPKKEPAKKETVKKTAPRKKTREIEELIMAAVKGMSDKEKETLILYLKAELNKNENKITALENNCKMAFEKLRLAEEEYASMERYYKERLGFIDQQVTAFGNAVKLSIVGGLN